MDFRMTFLRLFHGKLFSFQKRKKKVEKQGNNYKEQRIKNASKNSPIRNVLSLSQQHKKTRKKKGKINFEKKN